MSAFPPHWKAFAARWITYVGLYFTKILFTAARSMRLPSWRAGPIARAHSVLN